MTSELIDRCITIAARGAAEYLRVHKLRANDKVLCECLRSWIKAKLPEALADAKEALDCGMNQVAEQTFAATIFQAGIEAAKECGMPIPGISVHPVEIATGIVQYPDGSLRANI